MVRGGGMLFLLGGGLNESELKIERVTESLIIHYCSITAAQDQVLRSQVVKAKVHRERVYSKCKMR